MRRALFVLVAALALLGPIPAARASVTVLVIDGRGFGHGVGMAQDGAFWMGMTGAKTTDILGHFYPGTALAHGSGTVRVAVLVAPSRDAVVALPGGGAVLDAPSGDQSPGFPVSAPPGGQVHLWFDGAYHAQVLGAGAAPAPAPGAASAPAPAPPPANGSPTTAPAPAAAPTTSSTTTTTVLGLGAASAFAVPSTTLPGQPAGTTTSTTAAPPPTGETTTTSPAPGQSAPGQSAPGQGAAQSTPVATSSRPLWAEPRDGDTVSVAATGRRYRGVIEATADAGPLRLVDQLDVEQYLKGMGEVLNPRWPAPSLQAQAIAARTYALRAMAVAGELCDDQRCQVYLGQQVEYDAMNRAVDATRGQVIVYRKALAAAVYSANGGGYSATTREGFGPAATGNYPYLPAAPYTTRDPAPWSVRVGLADLAARFGYRGALGDVRVSATGPSGRALDVSLDGSAGSADVDGHAFAAGLGLRSTLFTLHLEQADSAPPAPEAVDLIQGLPGQVVAGDAPTAPFRGPAADALVPRLPDGPAHALALHRAGAAIPLRWRWGVAAVLLVLLTATSIATRGRGAGAPS